MGSCNQAFLYWLRVLGCGRTGAAREVAKDEVHPVAGGNTRVFRLGKQGKMREDEGGGSKES